jgi:hypothetical protein
MYPAANLVTIATLSRDRKRGIASRSDLILNSMPMTAKNIGAKKPNVMAEIVPYTLLKF